jgi:hypothetical protein
MFELAESIAVIHGLHLVLNLPLAKDETYRKNQSPGKGGTTLEETLNSVSMSCSFGDFGPKECGAGYERTRGG